MATSIAHIGKPGNDIHRRHNPATRIPKPRSGLANWLCFRKPATRIFSRNPFHGRRLGPIRPARNWLCLARSGFGTGPAASNWLCLAQRSSATGPPAANWLCLTQVASIAGPPPGNWLRFAHRPLRFLSLRAAQRRSNLDSDKLALFSHLQNPGLFCKSFYGRCLVLDGLWANWLCLTKPGDCSCLTGHAGSSRFAPYQALLNFDIDKYDCSVNILPSSRLAVK